MAPPPPGPTLGALLDMMRAAGDHGIDRSAYSLGDYSATALLVREGQTFRLFALHGGVLGVSPECDRAPDVGELLFEATSVDDLVGRLLDAWTPRFGKLLAANERLYARITGVDRAPLLQALRKAHHDGVSLADAAKLVNGAFALDASHARTVASVTRELGATVVWVCKRVQIRYEVVITALGKDGVTSALINNVASRARVSSAVIGERLRGPLPIMLPAKDETIGAAIRQSVVSHGAQAELREHVIEAP
ncbi:MAG: hypothetical protein H0T89_05890 [Deltaproteobacteria bacterium]|nr:hypothetical protein [Deltaproteobacteria bacterium]